MRSIDDYSESNRGYRDDEEEHIYMTIDGESDVQETI